jgi:Zn-dependent protease with chaperone function
MNNRISTKAPLLPVWLWFWLGVYVVTLPNLINYLAYLFQDFLSQYYTWSVEVGGESPFFELLRGTNLYEIAAYIVILIGVIYIFLPWIRGRRVERKHKLAVKDENLAVQEITAFVRQYVPNIQVKANLLWDTDQPAIAYPLGFRKPALGVFKKFFVLWRSDRKTAEAILLHEISHIRQGDYLVLGAGSLFETTAGYWVWIFLLFVCIPVVLYTGGSIMEVGSTLRQMEIFTTSLYTTRILQLLANGALTLIGEFLITFNLFVLPLAGIWLSELMADRLTAVEVESDETMQKAMALLEEEKGWKWKEKLIAGATHPPRALRRFLMDHFQSRRTMLLLIVSFPLMYIVKLIMIIGSHLPSLLIGLDDFLHVASLEVNTWSKIILPIFVAMTIWLLLWNWLEPWLGVFFAHAEKKDRSYSSFAAKSAVVPVVVAICAGIISLLPIHPRADETIPSASTSVVRSDVTPIPTVSGSRYKIGQAFQVGDAQVVVLGWETLTDSPSLQGLEGKKIIRVKINVRNSGEDSIAPLVSCARLIDATGIDYYFSFDDTDNSVLIDHDLPSDAPQTGQKIHGTISFLVDKNSDGFQFVYIANPPLDMTRASVTLTNDPSGIVSPPETLADSSNLPSASLNQALALKNFTVTVTKVGNIPSTFVTPEPGSKLVALDLTIKNTSSQPLPMASIFNFELEDEDGIAYFTSAIATGAIGKKLPAEDIAPGQEVNVSIGFKLPELLKKARLQYMSESGAEIELEIP